MVSGPEGTSGYVEVAIAKSLVADIQTAEVTLNGTEIDYNTSSLDDTWLLYFTYSHSSHNVVVKLGTRAFPESLPTTLVITSIIAIVVVCVGLLVYLKKLKR